MEPIDILLKQVEESFDALRAQYIRKGVDAEKERCMNCMKKANKQFDKIMGQLTEERLYLQARNRNSSAKLLRIQAKLQTLVSVMRGQIEVVFQQPDYWIDFKKERTRKPHGWTSTTTLKEILRAYNRWRVSTKAPQIKLEDLEKLSKESFPCQNDVYDIIVFLDEEDLEEYDMKSQ